MIELADLLLTATLSRKQAVHGVGISDRISRFVFVPPTFKKRGFGTNKVREGGNIHGIIGAGGTSNIDIGIGGWGGGRELLERGRRLILSRVLLLIAALWALRPLASLGLLARWPWFAIWLALWWAPPRISGAVVGGGPRHVAGGLLIELTAQRDRHW